MGNPGATITITLEAQTEKANNLINGFFSGLRDRVNLVKNLNAELQNGTRAANEFAAAIGTVLGVGAIRSFIQEAVQASRATAQLEAALKSSGRASKEFREELEAQRKAISEKIGADDDELVNVQRLLVTFNVQREQMKQMTELTLDYAAAMGIDAPSAAMNLGRALQGQDIVLRGMRVQLDQTLPKTEQLRMLMEILSRQVGGQAEALADPIRRFNVQLHDTEKALGRIMLNTFVTPFLKEFARGLADLEVRLKAFQKNHPVLVSVFRDMSAETGKWLAMLSPFILALGTAALAFKVLQFALSPIGPMLRLVRIGLAAVAGADVVGLLAQVRNYRDLAAALDLIVKNTALARLGFIGIAAAAGYGVGRFLGSNVTIGGRTVDQHAEGFLGRTFFGATDDRAARAGAEAYDALYRSILKMVDALLQSGKITPDMAESFRKQAFEIRSAGLSVDEYRKALTKLGEEVRVHVPGASGAAQTDLLAQEYLRKTAREEAIFKAAQTAAGTPAFTAAIEFENTQNELRYKFGEISLVKYLETRRRLIDQQARVETAPLLQALDVTNQDLVLKRDQLQALQEQNTSTLESGGIPDYAQEEQLQEEFDKLKVERDKLQSEVFALEARRRSAHLDADAFQRQPDFQGTMRSGLEGMEREWQNLGGNVAKTALNGIQSAVNGVSEAIMGAIDGTKTWGQVFSQIGRGIISSLIQIVVQWIASMTIIKALKRLFGAEDNQQAVQSSAAWAPAAVNASIASYGAAAVVGMAAYLAALGTGTAVSAALSAGPAGYEEGGYTGSGPKNKPAGIVHFGEVVIPADRVQQWGLYPLLEALRTGNVLPLLTSSAYAAPGIALAQSGGGGGPQVNHKTELNLANFADPVLMRKWADSQDGEVWFNDMLRKNLHRHTRR